MAIAVVLTMLSLVIFRCLRFIWISFLLVVVTRLVKLLKKTLAEPSSHVYGRGRPRDEDPDPPLFLDLDLAESDELLEAGLVGLVEIGEFQIAAPDSFVEAGEFAIQR